MQLQYFKYLKLQAQVNETWETNKSYEYYIEGILL